MDINWLKKQADEWQASCRSGRAPHAVLLHGPVGTGKRALAAWLAAERLGIAHGALPEHPVPALEHADLRWIAPLPDKASISIDQVRALVAELALTSYEGLGKVAVIEPADAMTVNAANSLLKTLEEPRGNTLLVLVVDRAGKLPATIYSRCQRLDIAAPSEGDALDWLDHQQPSSHWREALALAGGAPLAALTAVEQLDEEAALRNDLNEIAGQRLSPIEAAARWAKLDPGFVLSWLSRQIQGLIRAKTAGSGGGTAAIGDSVLRRMDTRNLFCYLDRINRVRGQAAGSYNVQLTLESLLIDWSNGLQPDTRPLSGMAR